MADLHPVAGAKIYIGGAKATQVADFVAADFAGQSWTEIDGWEQCGPFGDAAQVITTALINRGRDLKQKGTKNAGNMQNVFSRVNGDAGQSALKSARDDVNNYAFKILWDDMPSGGTSGTIHYFVALVTSYTDQGGGANTVRAIQSVVEINSNIVEVAAT